MLLQGKIAIITGASRGIGKSIAKSFIAQGATVAFTYRSSEEKAIELEKELTADGGMAKGFKSDASKMADAESLVKEVLEAYGTIDIVVNNAGITGPTAPLWEYDIEMWNKIVQINLVGTFNCCRAIVPNMIENNYGRIVNVASVAGKDGNANASAYSSGKAGTIGLTKSLGKELADKNIAVNAVTPAGAKTRILDQMSKEHVQRMLSKVPRGRFLEIHEFTSLVCWLSSEENTFSTAAVFDISGGRSTY